MCNVALSSVNEAFFCLSENLTLTTVGFSLVTLNRQIDRQTDKSQIDCPRISGKQNSTRIVCGTLELRAKASVSYQLPFFFFLVSSPLLLSQHQATMY